MYTSTKAARRKSQVWAYFTEVDEGKRARCSYCSKIISIAGGSIGNLKRHLGLAHQIYLDARSEPYQQLVNSAEVVFINAEDPAQVINCSDVMSIVKPKDSKENCDVQEIMVRSAQEVRTDNVGKFKEIDEQLLKMIVKEYHPFSLVEDPEFRSFVNVLCPEYRLPTKKMLSGCLLPQVYLKVAEAVNLKLEGAHDVCLTTDSWTSASNRNFMSVTAYFINPHCELDSILLSCVEFIDRDNAESIAEGLNETVHQWGLEDKVIAVVSNNANNLITGIQQCNWQHLTCFAHCINCVIQVGLFNSEINVTLNKIRDIVEYFNSSSTARAKLYSAQKQMGLPDWKIKPDISTRWNSTYNMMKRITDIKEAVVSVLTHLPCYLPVLTNLEWKIIEATVKVLQVFHEVTEEICSEDTVSRSKVILLVRLVNQSLISFENCKTLPIEVSSLATILKTELCKCFRDVEENKLSAEATILDPRFKKYGFSEDRKYRAAVVFLKEEVSNISLQVDPPAPKTENINLELHSVLWSDFDSQTQDVTVVQNTVSPAVVELENYLQEPLLHRTEDPLKWWKERQFMYPHLYEIVRKRLCLVATSVPCKRIFSKAGHIITERRNSITSSKLSQILFLNHNC